jgi:DNA-binding XRE family transcriptional regulator
MTRKKRKVPKTAMARYRAELKLKQTELASAFGVSEGTYRDWEKGQLPAWLRLACKGFAFCRLAGIRYEDWDGDHVVQARKRLALTQTSLAMALELSRATIGRYEAGTPPKWMAYAVMALAFDRAPEP